MGEREEGEGGTVLEKKKKKTGIARAFKDVLGTGRSA